MTVWKYRNLIPKKGRGSKYIPHIESHRIWEKHKAEMREMGVTGEAFADIIATYFTKVLEESSRRYVVPIKYIGDFYYVKDPIDKFKNKKFIDRNKKRGTLLNKDWYYKTKIRFYTQTNSRWIRFRANESYTKPLLFSFYSNPNFNPPERVYAAIR